jgi:multidrug/hemolysin transport system permease protein
MSITGALTRRSARLFLRDRAAVFFSFLSTLILIGLYFLFIARQYVQGIEESGAPLSGAATYFLVYSQMMAGVLILNTVSLSLGVFSNIAADLQAGRVNALLLTRARPAQITMAYYASGIAVTAALSLLTWAITYALIGLLTGYWLSLTTLLGAAGIILYAVFVGVSVMLLITALVRSPSALGTMSGVLGTFLGFLCGIYMPYAQLGTLTERIGSVLPFTHLTIWLKRTVLLDAFGQLEFPAQVQTELLGAGGFSASNIGFLGMAVPLWVMLVAAGVFGAGCLGAAVGLMRRKGRG